MEKKEVDNKIKYIIKEFDDKKAKEENRLQTLEDSINKINKHLETNDLAIVDALRKVEFIMENTLAHNDKEHRFNWLQDLWDEDCKPRFCEEHGARGFFFNPEDKCSICGKPPKVTKPNLSKEKIMEEFSAYFFRDGLEIELSNLLDKLNVK